MPEGNENNNGGSEGAQETPEEVAAREAQEAEATAQAGSGDDELSKARKEAAARRVELREAQAELKKLKDAQLTDTERTAAERDEALAAVNTQKDTIRALRVQVAAGKAGINPDLADTVPGLLNWDDIDESDPKTLERALKQLVKDRPALAGSGTVVDVDQGGRREQQQGAGDMNSILRRAAGRA
jgi:hypothetical protein